MLLTDMECEKAYEGLMRQTLRPQDKKTVLQFARAIESAVLEKLKAQEPALVRYNKHMNGEVEPDPVERLRFFLSLALTGQNWFDVEKFLDDLPPDDVVQKYEELLYEVHRKFPDETRHQTALRYIKTAESPSYTNAPMKEMK